MHHFAGKLLINRYFIFVFYFENINNISVTICQCCRFHGYRLLLILCHETKAKPIIAVVGTDLPQASSSSLLVSV